MAEKMTFSIAEVAAILGVSESNAYEMARKKEIPVRRVGGRILVPKKEFLAWWEGGIEMPHQERVG